MKRRKILIGAGIALSSTLTLPGLLAGRPAHAQGAEVAADERILGSPEAPVTIIEYASLTCPHCATFHAETLPQLKKTWIEPGRARLVYRDFPLDGLALRAAALAECFDGPHYFVFLDTLYRSQQTWARSQDPLGALAQTARLAGLDQKSFDACISDTAVLDRILKKQAAGKEKFKVQSTPTFVVNGRKIEGARSAAQFEKVLEEAESES